MDAVDFHDLDWVEKAWVRERTSVFGQLATQEWKDDDVPGSSAMDRGGKLCDPGDSALGKLSEEERIDVARSKQENLEYLYLIALTSLLKKLITFSSCTSRGPHKFHKCGHCDIPAFGYTKDLSRDINDIHETKKRYRCPVNGCKYGGAIGGRSFKRKDNFRRHLRGKHDDFFRALNLNLEIFLIVN
jgi:hypothetical protein